MKLQKLPFIVTALAMLLGGAAQAQPSYAVHEQTIKGRVARFDLPYDLYVRSRHGDLDHVLLHQGTIINPTGLTLESGMSVTVYGRPEGSVFAANEIDTPYHYAPRMYDYYPYGPGWYQPWGFGWSWGWRPWGWWP